MIIKVTFDKGMSCESFLRIHCPNKINIKRKYTRSKFFEWYNRIDNDENQLVAEMYGDQSFENVMIYWINTYLLDYEYGDKAYLLESNSDLIEDYDININVDSCTWS